MTTITVSEIKSQLTKVLKKVQQGESFAIAFGRKKEVLAYLVPKAWMDRHASRPLGLLAETAGFTLLDDFKMREEDLQSS